MPESVVSDVDRWSAVPHPAVVVDRGGTVVALTREAAALLPDAAVGVPLPRAVAPWLSAAHDAAAGSGIVASPASVSGRVDGRELRAVASPGADGTIVWWLLGDTVRSLHESRSELVQERERTAFLSQASEQLLASLNVDRCVETTVRLAARHLADAAVVVTPPSGATLSVASCDEHGVVRGTVVEADPDTVAGLSEALRGFPPIPSQWLDPAAVPSWLLPPGFENRTGSVIVTPLPGHGVSAGALVLLRRSGERIFDVRDEIFAQLFAGRAGIALSAARLYAEQTSITAILIRELLPPQLHRVYGIELAGAYRASENHEIIGGDFYDVHRAATPDGETLVVLGDVCGKGLEAAVLTGKIRNTIHALVPMADDHQRMLTLLNNALMSSRHGRFATLVLASAVHREGRVLLRLTSAGHPPPLIVRADGTVETAETRGQLVGALPDISATTFRTSLAPGETCLLYTDGVTEARGGPLGRRMFGEERLIAALAQCADMPAEAVVERIHMLTTQWVGRNQHDDIAVVAITAPRSPHIVID
ncbi:PP2C family protein-serine/threonine phosphatase [Nocardia africana]|uniref:Phosphoserine phosphatase rsbU n=1 Tax=Nocardia africana TaxID=134964 RepID=A0A378WUV0_9NOCA|nr:GAF domain-containing SpoIIE family protein phosphatase [Nocardia africana]MCC3313509.1 SpoIIE family protein phosphatase [Nocardia africana]SUA45120.1 Phosphoserine phosphatase rsbU [Nocardia africana]